MWVTAPQNQAALGSGVPCGHDFLMIRKLNDLSHLIIGSVCFFPLGVIAKGGVFVSGPDGKVMPISHEYIQAKFDLGKSTDIKNTLDVALIEDERKDVEVRELLARKIHAAEQPYNDYLELRDKAYSDRSLLLEAKVWLAKALVIWTDNYDCREAQREIDSVIALVASVCYEIDRSRENSEQGNLTID